MKKRFLSATALLLGAGVTWADPVTATKPVPPTAPKAPLAVTGTTTAAAPRSIKLPEAAPLQTPAPPMTVPAPTPSAPPATTPGPQGTRTPATAPAPAQANGVRQAQPAQAAAPKVDLRDCHCGPEASYWASAEYLLWWIKNGPVPVALVTTATGPLSTGALGQTGTSVAIGNTTLDYGTLSGARFEAGTWLNCRHTIGVDASFFFLGQGSTGLTANSNAVGAPLLARPFFNVVSSTQSAFLVSRPAAGTAPALRGGVAIDSESQIWGIESNFIRNLYYGCGFRADLLFGFRNINLEENLEIAQASTLIGAGSFSLNGAPIGGPGSQLVIRDRFGTVNHFYGGQIGGRFQFYRGAWVFDVLTKVALGVNHEAVNIFGQTDAIVGGAVNTATGGLLAVNNSNFGARINDTTNYFAVAPEVKLGVGYQLSKYLRAMVAWDFLYLNGVARPGNHIDTSVNPTLVPSSPTFAQRTVFPPGIGPTPVSGPFAPNLTIRQTDFWAQGINFGLLFTY